MQAPPTTQPTTLPFALSTICGAPCLKIGQDINQCCRQVKHAPLPELLWDQPLPPPPDSIATWLCKDSVFFTLIRSNQETLVFCHDNQTLYYASPAAQLAPECPVGTAFLCQFTTDHLPEGQVPRLLVFDMVSPVDFSPQARSERLRSYGQCLPQPLCHIQWVGFLRYLTPEFVRKLPHRAEGLFCLGSDPCDLGFVQHIA